MKRILCIHGIGHKEAKIDKLKRDWKGAIGQATGFGTDADYEFLMFDELFETAAKVGIDYRPALQILIKSWKANELLQQREPKISGIENIVNGYAGMVAQFVVDTVLVENLMKLWEQWISDYKPDIIFAHSLGALISYDYFRKASAKGRSFDIISLVTAGAQIGHPALKDRFDGQVERINVKHWLNLHNCNDHVFASKPINLKADNFLEIGTPFFGGVINHDAVKYIENTHALKSGWPVIV